MPKFLEILQVAAMLLAGMVAAVPAGAQTIATAPTVADPVTAAPDEPFGAADAVTDIDLRGTAGREDIGAMVASATQRNTVSNNSVTGTSTTGNVQIVGNAFQNLQGLAVISANSGNNVAMNAAMNVTVNLAPK